MFQIPELLKFPKLFHAFSTVPDGNMANSILGKFSNFDQVLINRQKFLSKLGINIENCICMWVTHGEDIIEPPKKSIGKSMKDYKKALKVDGLITNKKDIYLFLLAADCLPIILYDLKKEVLALVHAGWTGVDKEIVKKAVRRFIENYNSKPEDLIVGLGPAARADSFIKENPSQRNDPKWQSFLEKVGETKYKVDFVGLCKKQLIDSGIKEENIFDCGIDTVKDQRFFSHYRDKEKPYDAQGRFACVVGIK